jgi:predicted acylesterase/phospholipase RssA
MSDRTHPNIPIGPNPVSESALCLSGGGLRATFFHFGVVKALADADRLKNIKHIISVSGGSILAGHMIRMLSPLKFRTEPLGLNAR